MKQLLYLFPLLCILSVVSCDKFRTSAGQDTDSVSLTVNEYQWDTLSVDVQRSVNDSAQGTGYHITVHAVLTGNEAIDTVLTARLFGKDSEPHRAMQVYVDSLEQAFREELSEMYGEDFDDDDMPMQYEYLLNCSPEPMGQADGVISYYYSIESYTGGAHGMYVGYYLNFSSEDGHLLTLGELYDGDPCPAMMQQLLKDNDCTTREELMEKTQILMLDELYPTDNFLFKGDSILFRFNPYEIAPYSAGAIEVTIPCR